MMGNLEKGSVSMKFLSTIRGKEGLNWKKDAVAGLIVAAVSIPISMGYAQIAGLPAVYGLYGSVLPIIIFSLVSTSGNMIFGVDAAPAALVGGVLVTAGVASESSQAMAMVPVITLFTALWLLGFSLLKVGSLVKYISEPVMGGFISGIGVTIITMQIPKLFGGTSGSGEFFELAVHVVKSLGQINGLSLAIGLAALAVILAGRRFAPKIPMAVIVMGLGALGQIFFHLDRYGVKLLPQVHNGLPALVVPDVPYAVSLAGGSSLIVMSLSVALVIMAETLLASNSMASKKGYKLDDNQEIMAYALGNAAAAFTGCCPVNGSVSRMGIADQFEMGSQLTGLVAGAAMTLLLLFGTGFIGFLPVPVLTAIVIAALTGVVEFGLARRLYLIERREFYIFLGAFLGVLAFGTVYGVIIGVILSFGAVVMRTVNPPRSPLGVIPGHEGFHRLKNYPDAQPIQGAVIYRFSASLFFANIDVFESDIENSLQSDTRVVIVDASGVTSLDVTAAERIGRLYEEMKKWGIRFYLTEHISEVNTMLRQVGCKSMIEEGGVQRHVRDALRDAGYKWPYPLEGKGWKLGLRDFHQRRIQNDLQWAFGEEADAMMDAHVLKNLQKINPGDGENLEQKLDHLMEDDGIWSHMSQVERASMLEHLEMRIKEVADKLGENEETIESAILKKRAEIARALEDNPEFLRYLVEHQEDLDRRFAESREQAFKRLVQLRRICEHVIEDAKQHKKE